MASFKELPISRSEPVSVADRIVTAGLTSDPWIRAFSVLLGIFAPISATLIELGYQSTTNRFPFLLFYPAVFVATVFGGATAGAISILCSWFLLNYFILKPHHALFALKPGETVPLAIFVLTSALVVWAVYLLRVARQRSDELAEENATLAEANSRLLELEKSANQRLRFLAEAGRSLNVSLEYEKTLANVVAMMVPEFADDCLLYLLDSDRTVRLAKTAHRDPSRAALFEVINSGLSLEKYPNWPLTVALNTAYSQITPRVTAEIMRERATSAEELELFLKVDARSSIMVPLKEQQTVIGAMAWISHESGRVYDASALAFAEQVADRVAVAIQNARLYRTAQDNVEGRDRFLAFLGHELRNPLSAISNAVKVLDLIPGEDQRLRRFTELIGRQTLQLTNLVNDLLDISRVVTGKIVLRKSPVDLRKLVSACVESLMHEVESHGHEVSLSLPPEPVMVEADPVRLEQLLGNLLQNAAKYTAAPGRITVTLRREGKEAVLSVGDTGVGIPREMLSNIFEPFAQSRAARALSSTGLGLGLALVRQIAELHGGKVRAASAGLGRGSEFIVRLPVSADAAIAQIIAPAIAARAETVTTNGSKPRVVLLVEDNPDVRDSLRAMLEAHGIDVRVADNGQSGINLARTERPDVAIVDIGLPDMDGYQVAARLRIEMNGRPIRLIALTGYGQMPDRERSLAAGFDFHLVKPCDPAELISLLSAS